MSEDFPPTHKPSVQPIPQTIRSPGRSKYVLLAGGLLMALALTLVAIFIYKSRQSAASLASAPGQTMGDGAKRLEARILQGEALTGADIADLSGYELRVLRNVHFARHGRSYDRPGLGDYFYTCSWYQPRAEYNDNLLTATDRANISLILPEENRVKAAEAASATNTPATSAGGSIFSFSSSSSLTTENVQRAVDQLLDSTKKGGSVRVVGIQELPEQSAAKADIRFEEFQYNSNNVGTPVSKNQATPPKPDINSPNYYADALSYMNQQVRVSKYSGEGFGVLKHYNDGRWVLTSVQFKLTGVSGSVQIQ